MNKQLFDNFVSSFILDSNQVQSSSYEAYISKHLNWIAKWNEKLEYCATNKIYSNKKRGHKITLCTGCNHLNAKHYAKRMCSNCYHSKGRKKQPWNCPHKTKPNYAWGLCQNCYQYNYTKCKKEDELQDKNEKAVISTTHSAISIDNKE